jgi:hypothetical protein
MTRRKALAIAVSAAGLSGLFFALLWLSNPVPALSYASYAYKPGCHCGKPTATTVKATTTTAKKTTTTAKKTTTTAKTTTTTAKKATTTATTAKKAATAVAATSSTKTSTKSSTKSSTAKTKSTKRSTTTTSGESDGQDDQSGGLALGAAVASFTDAGDGGSSGGAGDSGAGSLGATGLLDSESVAAVSSGPLVPPHYYFSPVAIAFLLVYGVSFALYRAKRLRVATHRKIWNLLLLATFLLCAVLGLVLAVGVTRPVPWQLPTWLLVWHVETGIAMSFISFFHIGWHLRYYLAIVTGKHRAPRAEKAPAAEREADRERARRPRAARPVLVRSEEERMQAFEHRQASRSAQSRATRPAPESSEAQRWVEEARRRAAPAT